MNGTPRVGATLLCLMLAGGCATASTGTTQAIKVGSQPEGAECVLTREGKPLGSVTTPGSVTVSRARQPISVVCTKGGYDEARAVLNSLTRDPVVVGGLGVISGVIAAAALVDMASGANHHYQSALMLKLEPLSATDQAAAAETPPGNGAVAPAPATAAVLPAPARLAGTLPAAGSWECGLKNSSRTYKLQFVVAADHSVVVTSYANAPASIVNKEPLTFSALNPRGSRPMTIIWNRDNTMVISGPNMSGGTFQDEGACAKV